MNAPADSVVCQNPREVKIRHEQYRLPCGSRECAVCGARWEKDQRVRAVAASEQLEHGVALVTVTAPGKTHFVPGEYLTLGSRRAQMDDWNRSARRRWRLLHLRASRRVRPWAQALGADWRVLYRSWEYQKRGVLHLHLVLPHDTWEERWCTELYVHYLWSLARSYHFGYVLGGDDRDTPGWVREPNVPTAAAESVARYVCKYVASIGHGKDSMRSVAKRTAKRGSVLYIAPKLTRASGVTMTSLRARRRIYARYPWARESTAEWGIACQIDALQRGCSPLTRSAEGGARAVLTRSRGSLCLGAATGGVSLATAAPPPLCAVQDDHPPAGPPRRVVAVLASVRLRDPERPDLGDWRTDIVDWVMAGS